MPGSRFVFDGFDCPNRHPSVWACYARKIRGSPTLSSRRSAEGGQTEFAADSPVEGDGFELSVPGGNEPADCPLTSALWDVFAR
jgi:hypothetical protein